MTADDADEQLPSGVAQADFLLWSVNDDPSRQTSKTLSINEVTRIAKISDALGDSVFDDWLGRLSLKVSAFDWNGPGANEALCGLLLLPSHLQRDLFAVVLDNIRQIKVAAVNYLLEGLPAALYGAVISSQVTPKGNLNIVLPFEDPLIVDSIHASQLHLEAPGIVFLGLRSPNSPATSPGMLAAALTSHTALTRLELDRVLSDDHASIQLFQQLHVLQQLQHLDIFNCKFTGLALQPLAEAIPCLPHLITLGVSDIAVPAGEVRATSVHAAACQSFMQALSVAPKLQDLDVAVLRLPCAVHSLQGSFSSLQSLTLCLRVCTEPCLEFIEALTSVTQLHLQFIGVREGDNDEYTAAYKSASAHEEMWRFVCEVLARFPSLASLALNIWPLQAASAACYSILSDTLKSMNSMNELVLSDVFSVEGLDFCSFEDALTHLHFMHLRAPADFKRTELYSGLASLSSLQSFEYGCDDTVDCLPALRQLSSLRISAGDMVMRMRDSDYRCSRRVRTYMSVLGAGVAAGLQHMSNLKRLDIMDAVLFDYKELFRVLPSLSMLARLRVTHFYPTACDLVPPAGLVAGSRSWVPLQDADVEVLCESLETLQALRFVELQHTFSCEHLKQLADSVAALAALTGVVLSYDRSGVGYAEGRGGGGKNGWGRRRGSEALPSSVLSVRQQLQRSVQDVELVAFPPC